VVDSSGRRGLVGARCGRRSDGFRQRVATGVREKLHDLEKLELSDDKVKRMTNLLDKARELLRPKFRAAKLKPYNSTTEFIFLQEEGGACMFDENRQVRVYCRVTNDPKGVSKRPWRVVIDAMWDVGQAKFVSQKIRPATKEDDEG
jgi:hypothetical protein